MAFSNVMKFKWRWSVMAVLAGLLFASLVHAQVPIVQPGAPGQSNRLITADEAANLANIKYSLGDIQFLRGMIPHHAQAKEMSALAEDRTNTDSVLAVAARITASQDDEIAMMQGWLTDRGLEAPAQDEHHDPDFERMPGMLSDEEMAELAAASGPEFDRLYLEYMIDHHQGALDMVEELLDQQGSAQDPLLLNLLPTSPRIRLPRLNAWILCWQVSILTPV